MKRESATAPFSIDARHLQTSIERDVEIQDSASPAWRNRRDEFEAVSPHTVIRLGECGLACMIGAFKQLGVAVSMRAARAVLQPDAKGASIRELIALADRFGFLAQSFRAEPEEYAEIPRPALLHWRGDHYVLLHGVDDESVTLLDPSGAALDDEGLIAEPWVPRRVPRRHLAKVFDGVFIHVQAAPTR